MNTTNIFCIVAKTGAGKTKYINSIFEDKDFVKETNLELLVYGTTRPKRNGEVEGVDYYYHTEDEYNNIPDKDLIEYRSYYTLNDGEIYYFTKVDYFNKNGNIICTASPYQYESYKDWVFKENLKGYRRYNLFVIIIDTNLKIRIKRILNRATKDADIYEMCRRIIQERSEFDDVSQRHAELLDCVMLQNACIINNNSCEDEEINNNIDKLKSFIREKLN